MLKKSIFVLILVLSAVIQAQTNTFPDNGDVGVGTISPKAGLHVKSASISETSTTNHDANFIIEGTDVARSMSKGATLGFVVPANTNGANPWQQGRIMVTPDDQNNGYATGRMLLQTRYLKILTESKSPCGSLKLYSNKYPFSRLTSKLNQLQMHPIWF